MSWFLLEEPAAVENDGSYSCHSISPLRVWSRNECGSHWSLPSVLHRIWNKVVRHLKGSLACAHSGGISMDPWCRSCLCSQVELRWRTTVEQVQLLQHASVCGRGAGRAGRGDAHHDVSSTCPSLKKCKGKREIRQIARVFELFLSTSWCNRFLVNQRGFIKAKSSKNIKYFSHPDVKLNVVTRIIQISSESLWTVMLSPSTMDVFNKSEEVSDWRLLPRTFPQ